MSTMLKSMPRSPEVETIFVGRSADTSPATSFRELSRVVVLIDVATIEGDRVSAGSAGTVVAVWTGGDLYDVEFGDALGPVTVAGGSLRSL